MATSCCKAVSPPWFGILRAPPSKWEPAAYPGLPRAILQLKGKERLGEVVRVRPQWGPLVPHGTRAAGHHNRTHRLSGCAAALARCCNTDTSSEPKTSTPILGLR